MPKMEKLVEQGLTKSIGVSNYNVQNILIVLSICKHKPVVNEVEFNPYLYQKDLKEFCDKENIKIFSYYPLVKGRFCTPELVKEKDLDLLNEPVVKKLAEKYEKIMKEKGLDLLNEDIVKDLAKKYGKSVGQIILNWHMSVGVIPIPGTSKPSRMKENLGAVGFKMEDAEYQSLSDLCAKEYRFCDSLPLFGIDIFA